METGLEFQNMKDRSRGTLGQAGKGEQLSLWALCSARCPVSENESEDNQKDTDVSLPYN